MTVELSQFIPGLLVALLFGLATGPWAARRWGTSRSLGTALMASFGAVVALTLTPGGDVAPPGSFLGSCDLTRFGPPSLADLSSLNEVSLNVILFIPLGISIGLLARSRLKAATVVAAIALPFAIEAIQLVVVPLGRYCDSADVSDNLIGLVFGLALGTIIGGAVRHRVRAREVAAAGGPGRG